MNLSRPPYVRWPSCSRCQEILAHTTFIAVLLILAFTPFLALLFPDSKHAVGMAVLILIGIGQLLNYLVTMCDFTRYVVQVLSAGNRGSALAISDSLEKGGPYGSLGSSKLPSIIVLIPIYNEDPFVFAPGLHRINSLPQAERVIMVIGLEERASGNEVRESCIRSVLTRVKEVHIFKHPAGLPEHLPGIGSNLFHAMKCFFDSVVDSNGGTGEASVKSDEYDECLFCKIDAQVLVHPTFFSRLEEKHMEWLQRNPDTTSSAAVVWQPYVAHGLNSEQAWSFSAAYCQSVEIRAIGRDIDLCAAAYCCYAMPLRVLARAGLHHPGAVAEDQTLVVQVALDTSTADFMTFVDCPVLKACTAGDDVCTAFREFYKQQARFDGGIFFLLPMIFSYRQCGVFSTLTTLLRLPEMWSIPCTVSAVTLWSHNYIVFPPIIAEHMSAINLCCGILILSMYIIQIVLQRLVIDMFPEGDCQPYSILSLVIRLPMCVLMPWYQALRCWMLICYALLYGWAGQVYQEREKTRMETMRPSLEARMSATTSLPQLLEASLDAAKQGDLPIDNGQVL